MGALGVLAASSLATTAPPVPGPDSPDHRLTPGAHFAVGKAAICTPGYSKRVRHVPESEKNQVYALYGITRVPYGYEVDHLVSLEVGGSNSIKNLWPEHYYDPLGARTKDRLENKLHALICSGQLGLASAQRQEAANWIAAYRKYVGPLPSGTTTTVVATDPIPTATTTTVVATDPIPTSTALPDDHAARDIADRPLRPQRLLRLLVRDGEHDLLRGRLRLEGSEPDLPAALRDLGRGHRGAPGIPPAPAVLRLPAPRRRARRARLFAAPALADRAWQSPSGNIVCHYYASSRAVVCTTMNDGQITLVNQYGGVRKGPNHGAYSFARGPALSYGKTITFAGLICTSQSNGMVCVELATCHGFMISRSVHYVSRQPCSTSSPKLSVPQKSTAASPAETYFDTGSGHWISDVSDGGNVVRLEDGSTWLIEEYDRSDTQIWLVVDSITVLNGGDPGYPYRLVNTDEGEVAHAKYLGT